MTNKNSLRLEIKIAAKALGCSERTVHRYIERGLLTRVKEKGKLYVIPDEVSILKQKLESDKKKRSAIKSKSNDKVTVNLSHYELLIAKIGQLEENKRLMLEYKAQSEEQQRALAEYKIKCEENQNVIADHKEKIERKSETIKKAKEFILSERQKIQDLEKELERQQAEMDQRVRDLKKRGLLKRLFNVD